MNQEIQYVLKKETEINFNQVARKDPVVVFLGLPLIDMIVEVDDAFLTKRGFEPDGKYSFGDDGQDFFDELKSLEPTRRVGGSVTNTARAFRKLTQLNLSITYLGTIGEDDFGKLIMQTFNDEKIRFRLFERIGEPTGLCGVLLTGKKRTLVTHTGRSKCFKRDYLKGETWNHVTKGSYFYFSAFSIGNSMRAIKKIVLYFVSNKKLVAFNLGAPSVCRNLHKHVKFFYRHANIIFGNEAEHRTFARLHFKEEIDDIVECVTRTVRRFAKHDATIIVTRGGQPVLAVGTAGHALFPVKPVEQIRDTNGAGDVFVGGYLASHASGSDTAACVNAGIEAAREAIQHLGCNLI